MAATEEKKGCLCEGRGILHIQVMRGMWEIEHCKCQPEAYWIERREASWNEFKAKLEKARIELGMLENDANQITGR